MKPLLYKNIVAYIAKIWRYIVLQKKSFPTPYFSELSHYIKNRQLSDALNLLEKRGFTGDLAFFIIGCIILIDGGAA